MDKIGVVLAKGLSNASAEQIAKGKGKVANDVSAQWLPEFEFKVEALPADAPAPPDGESIFEPETAFFYNLGYQWNMEITDTDDAWRGPHNGIPSVRVAILDTGLDPNHVDQVGLIDVASSRAFIPSLTGPPDWQDDHFHGTHVGGIVTSNNFGTAGVASDVTLIAVKVLGATGSGTFGAVLAGIYHAADVGADVINMSLGAYFEKSGNTAQLVAAFNRAVNYAHARGVFVVASAGNAAQDLQHDQNFIEVPCETGVLSCISATGPADAPAYYTNYGTNSINNAAPGGDFTQPDGTGPPGPSPLGFVLSLCTTRSVNPALFVCRATPPSPPNLGFFYLWAQGTSMAAPHIAGLGAYLDSQYGGTLNGSQILTQIQQHADDLGKPGADPYFGKGRMNTCRTLPGCLLLATP
jgi:subtilisin family serine protease